MTIYSKHSVEEILSFPEWKEDNIKSLVIQALTELEMSIQGFQHKAIAASANITWRSWGDEILVKIDGNQVSISVESPQKSFINSGSTKKTLNLLVKKIQELSIAQPKLYWDEKTVENKMFFEVMEENDKVDSNDWKLLFSKNGIPATLGLIATNALVFLLMIGSGTHFMNPESDDLLHWGANFLPSTLNNESWRLFTSVFIHIGFIHLLMNMYALFYIGVLLESEMGKVKFLLAYLISGVVGSVASLWWNDFTVSAGASGAIFGMYGVFLAFFLVGYLKISENKSLFTSIGVFIVFNVMYGLRPDSNIDNAAHMGGFISGLLIGLSFVPMLKKTAESDPENEPKNTTGLYIAIFGVLIVAMTAYFTFKSIPKDIVAYQIDMERFSKLEQDALNVYTLYDNSNNPPDEQLNHLKSIGIINWKKTIEILDSYTNAALPNRIKERNTKLKKYCELRLESFLLLKISMEENTNAYDSQLSDLYEEIQKVLDELNAE